MVKINYKNVFFAKLVKQGWKATERSALRSAACFKVGQNTLKWLDGLAIFQYFNFWWFMHLLWMEIIQYPPEIMSGIRHTIYLFHIPIFCNSGLIPQAFQFIQLPLLMFIELAPICNTQFLGPCNTLHFYMQRGVRTYLVTLEKCDISLIYTTAKAS